MLQRPLVSIICTCYNHEKYIQEALDSVARQEYPFIELLIIDNGSTDNSASIIQEWGEKNLGIMQVSTRYYTAATNYCQVFNVALSAVKGKYLIDLSGDDMLLPGHVATAVSKLEESGCAVYFSDALLWKPDGSERRFYEGRPSPELVMGGDLYRQVVEKYVISTVTLVFRTEEIRRLGGYDGRLVYEDFDILVRMARYHKFVFDPHVGVRKRILPSSFAAGQYRVRTSIMLDSTLQVLRKIRAMNHTEDENKALLRRTLYECRHALASANFQVGEELSTLAWSLGVDRWKVWPYRLWSKLKVDVSWLYARLRPN